MGLNEKLADKRVYLDTNIFIYAFEAASAYRSQLQALARLFDERKCEFITSELTLAEILTKPFRDHNLEAIKQYREVLEGGTVRLVPISKSVLISTAILRGQLGLKTPDAVHVSTAAGTGCSAFLTNDSVIRLPKSIELVLFGEN
jgi:predicted nucleic acid-binding protein